MAPGLTTKPSTRRRGRRALAGCLVLAVVLAVHGWLADRLAEATLGWGSADKPPERLEIAFVKELRPAAPPAVAPAPRPPAPPRKRAVQRPAPAASAPASAAAADSAPEPSAGEAVAAASSAASASAAEMPAAAASGAVVAAAASAPDDETAAAAPSTTTSAAASSADSAAQPAFGWPPSTRLSYTLTGNVQGPVEGWARVQWIRQGLHYQVQMDTRVALVASRKMTSDGELTPEGLRPRRYDEETDLLIGTPRRARVRFEDDYLLLSDGREVPRPPGVQDTASQLVQLVWLFTAHPELLRSGRSVELPLALPWRVDTWVYDVLEAEEVETPFGLVPAMHVKPRRPSRPGNVLIVECWFAPTLRYLPVRIRIEQKADTWLDLRLDQPPLQAAQP